MNPIQSPTPTSEQTAFSERRKKFIGSLLYLEDSNDGPSRSGLAALRAGLRSKNGIAIEMMPFVVPFLDEREHRNDRWFFAIAALFALHPRATNERLSLGGSFGQLRENSASMEKRFQLLLASDEEDLFERLKQTMNLLKAHNVPVNWFALLRDLTVKSWDDPQRELQLKWARDFYKEVSSRSASNAT